MAKRGNRAQSILIAAVATVLAAVPTRAQEAPYCPVDSNGRVATVFYEGTLVWFEPLVEHESLVLTVTTPCSIMIKEFKPGQNPYFDVNEVAGEIDGAYTWELRVAPVVDPAVRRELEKSRDGGDPLTALMLQQKGLLPSGPLVDSAAFTVVEGRIVQPDEKESTTATATRVVSGGRSGPPTPVGLAGELRNVTAADQVIPDDLIVQASLCVGFDCVNNESFSFDTIRLKENNLRIKFEDTSVGSFPTNDWQLTANDSASGGASKFSIEDITGAKVPFTIRAGAATNSVFVDSIGRVGFRTSTPVLDLHVNTSNTPGLRLEQNSSGGFTAQTWDIAGNEANFFVRDVTGGSRLPFRIRPGAPTSSIDISADGDVGVGTASPANSLHVSRSDGTAKVLIEENSGTNSARELLELRNLGGAAFILDDEADASRWTTSNVGSQYLINNQANAGIEVTVTSTGNMTIAGTLTQNSDRTTKTDIAPVDPQAVLTKVAQLPISTWRKVGDQGMHLGPMAQDFAAAFGLGESDRQVALIDLAGVSLAAIQALEDQAREKNEQIQTLQERLAALEALVATIAKP